MRMNPALPTSLVALATTLAALVIPARAAEPAPLPARVQKPKVAVEILTDVTAVAPGETFRVAARFTPDPHWHVYWKNPGAIGLPTELTFEAPDGWSFGAIGWPLPQRIVSKIGDVSFGYEGELVLVSSVRVPEGALDGSEVPIAAKARWLVCNENCIQGSADVGVTLSVASTPRAERVATEVATKLDAWQARIPLPLGDGRAPMVKSLSEAPAAKPGAPFSLRVTLTGTAPIELGDAATAFLPATPDGLEVQRVERVAADGNTLDVRIAGVAGPLAEPLVSRLDGVFLVTVGGTAVAFDASFEVPREAGPSVLPDLAPRVAEPSASMSPTTAGSVCATVTDDGERGGDEALTSFLVALFFAFVGGIILNAMPCVLPVLSLKILSLVEQSQADRKVIWRHGLAYTAGVLASFATLAAILLALQAPSWAYQMQSPIFVAVFTAIVFGFALSLFGVFELTLPFAGRLEGTVASRHGYSSSFTYGIFAVLLGTPCTAPFLGPAMAYAFTLPAFEMMLLMLTVGFGLAFPFLLVAAFPGWRKVIPKPGPWLDTFKKVMGFLLVGTAIFLLHTLSGQVSRDAFTGYLVFLAVLSFGLFVYGHWGSFLRARTTRAVGTIVALGLVVGGAALFVSTEPPPPPAGTRVEGGITWHEFDLLDVEAEAAKGKTVFIDFTADWCVTCKSNEALAIFTDPVRSALSELEVLPVRGDFTVHKPEIAKWLTRFNQPSVPLYVVIPAGRPEAAFALSSLPSTSEIVQGLCRAGPSTAVTAAR
ncbi:MAG: thioredoxin family protein [Deltaproteobacteria bacterium]|nr:thioredoxin family protein [Deltaproteobacteria bacterium]